MSITPSAPISAGWLATRPSSRPVASAMFAFFRPILRTATRSNHSRLRPLQHQSFYFSSNNSSKHISPCQLPQWFGHVRRTGVYASGLTAFVAFLLYNKIHADSANPTPETSDDSIPQHSTPEQDSAPAQAPGDDRMQEQEPIDPWEALFQALTGPLEEQFNTMTDAMYQSAQFPEGLNDDSLKGDTDPLYRFSWQTCTIPYIESGVARIDAVCVPKGTIPDMHTYSTSHFCVLPTHTWSLFGVFPSVYPSPRPNSSSDPDSPFFKPSISRQTQPSSQAALYLYDKLLLAIVGAMADLFSSLASTPTIHTEVGLSESVGTASELFYHYQASERPSPSDEVIDRVVQDAFLDVDNTICHEVIDRVFNHFFPRRTQDADASAVIRGYGKEVIGKRERAWQFLAPAYAAAEACIGFYESDTRVLKIANTGSKVRAILCRQKVSNPQKAHDRSAPREYMGIDLAISNNSVFGDAQYSGKWTRDVQRRLYEEFMGELPLEDDITIEQRTAKPTINSVQTKPKDILVLISGAEDHLNISPSSPASSTPSTSTPSGPALSADHIANIVGVWLHHSINGQHKATETIRLASDIPLTSTDPTSPGDNDDEEDYPYVAARRARMGCRAAEVSSLYPDPFKSTLHPKATGDLVGPEVIYASADDANVAMHVLRNVVGLQRKTVIVTDEEDSQTGEERVIESIAPDLDLAEARVRYMARGAYGAYAYGGGDRPREEIGIAVVFFE